MSEDKSLNHPPGYFAYHHATLASRDSLFGQLWKEYSLSDIRYLTQDSFVVCMETVTAVCWGPLSFLCATWVISEHPARHPLQIIISLGQLYGDILYYATVYFEVVQHGGVFCRPERYYFWAYFMLMNAFWIVIPLSLIWRSTSEITRVFKGLQSSKAKTS